MKIEIVQFKYRPYRHQLHTYVYNHFLKVNCFIHRLKVFRSGALLVSSGGEFQVEIAKYRKVFSPKEVVATFGTRFREMGDSG